MSLNRLEQLVGGHGLSYTSQCYGPHVVWGCIMRP